MSSDRKLRRRRMVSRSVGGSAVCATSVRPPAVLSIPSCASAASISVTNSGLPAAPASPASSPWPGAVPTASAARSATAAAPRPPRLRYRPGGPASEAASRSSSAERGDGRKHAMRATGRYSARRPSAASVSRLDASAHCRSSTPITSGPASASSSTRSASASTTRNRRPGSLVTVIGLRSPVPPDSSSPMAARRGSVADLVQPNTPVIRPNGRMPSSSSARPAATCMPRRRASSSAASSSRVLPMPASPSMSTTARRPDSTRSSASPSTAISASRPRMADTCASVLVAPAPVRPIAGNRHIPPQEPHPAHCQQRYGLRSTAPADGTAARRPARAENEKAARRGLEEAPRITCAASAAKPPGSRDRAIPAARFFGIAGARSHLRLGRMTSPQISGSTPRPRAMKSVRGFALAQPVSRSHAAASSLHPRLPAASAPLAIHRPCQLRPGCSSSQCTSLVRPIRRLDCRSSRSAVNGGAGIYVQSGH